MEEVALVGVVVLVIFYFIGLAIDDFVDTPTGQRFTKWAQDNIGCSPVRQAVVGYSTMLLIAVFVVAIMAFLFSLG